MSELAKKRNSDEREREIPLSFFYSFRTSFGGIYMHYSKITQTRKAVTLLLFHKKQISEY